MVFGQPTSCSCGETLDFNRNVGTGAGSHTRLSDLVFNPQPGQNPWPASVVSGCIRVWGTFEIDIPYTFQTVDGTMMPGSRLLISNGSILTTNSFTHLHGCDIAPFNQTMWHGVEVSSFSTLTSTRTNFSHARWAINLMDESSFSIFQCRFNENYIGVRAADGLFNYIHPYLNRPIQTNWFTCVNPLRGSPISGESFPLNRSAAAFWLENNDFFTIGSPDPGVDLWNDVTAHVNGVVVRNSNFTHIHDMLIHDLVWGLTNNQPTPEQGVGVVINSGNPIKVVNNNTITGVVDGIHATFSGITADANTVTAQRRGIFADHSPLGDINIWNNTVSASTGIAVAGASGEKWHQIITSNNSVSSTGVGIYVVQNSLKTKIEKNPVTPIHHSEGIWVDHPNGIGLVKGNEVTGDLNDGILIQGAAGWQFVENKIVGSGVYTTGGSEAIDITFSNNVLLCCNDLNETHRGLAIQALDLDIPVWNSQFGEHLEGLVLAGNSDIGDQFNHGNTWANANCLWRDAYYVGSLPPDVAATNRFKVEPALLPNQWDKIFVDIGNPPVSFSGMTWFSILGSDPACNNSSTSFCGQDPISIAPNDPWEAFTSISNTDRNSANLPAGSTLAENGTRWMRQQYLFEKLVNVPDLVAQDEDVAAFYENAANSEIGAFQEMKMAIKNAYHASPTNAMLLQNLEISLSGYHEDLNALEILLQNSTGEDSISLAGQKTTLIGLVLPLLQQYSNLQTQIQAERVIQANDLIDQNDALPKNSVYQENEFLLNDIELRDFLQGNFTLTQTQKEVVQHIAEQCAFEGGYPVLKARAIRQLSENTIFEYNDDCWLPVEERTSVFDEGSLVFKIIPNPSGGENVKIQWSKSIENGSVSINSIHGIQISSFKIDSNSTEKTLQLNSLAPGIYFVKVWESGRVAGQSKLVIFK